MSRLVEEMLWEGMWEVIQKRGGTTMDWIEYGRTILKQEGHDDWSFRLDIEAQPSLCIHSNKYIWLAKAHQDDIFRIIHEIAHIPFLDLSEGDVGHHRKWADEFHRLLTTYVTPLSVGRTVEEIGEGDRRATQLHMISSVLTAHCGPDFTAGKIEAAMADVEKEMLGGSCAWAFDVLGVRCPRCGKAPCREDVERALSLACETPLITDPRKGGGYDWYHDGPCRCESSPPGFVAQDGIHCGMCGGTVKPREPPTPAKESWECTVSPLERLSIIEAVKDGELLYDAHKRIVGRPPEESKTIPQVVIDAFKDDEASLLQEHLERKEEEESLIDEPPLNPPLSESPWSKDHPSPVSLIPGVIKHPIQCCRKCVSFHQSRARQLVSLADPGAPNDGCKCQCHESLPKKDPDPHVTQTLDDVINVLTCENCGEPLVPNTTVYVSIEGKRCHYPGCPPTGLTKHFDKLDLQDEVDKMEEPKKDPQPYSGEPSVHEIRKDALGLKRHKRPPAEEPWICPHRKRCIFFEQRRCHGQIEGFCMFDDGHPPARPGKGKLIPPYYINMNNGRPECPECGALYKHRPGDGVRENCVKCGANMVLRELPVTDCNHCAGTGEAKLDKDGNELYNGFMGKCPYCSPPTKEVDDMIGRGGTDPNEREPNELPYGTHHERE